MTWLTWLYEVSTVTVINANYNSPNPNSKLGFLLTHKYLKSKIEAVAQINFNKELVVADKVYKPTGCPNCGGNKFSRSDSRPGWRKCEFCSAESEADLPPQEDKDEIIRQLKHQVKMLKEDPDYEVPEDEEEEEVSSPADEALGLGCGIFVILAILAFFGYICVGMFNEAFIHPVTITTNGLYQIPKGCSDGGTVVEFGIKGQNPLFSVYPETENDRWHIPEQYSSQSQEAYNTHNSYLWVHCVDDVTNEYYSQSYPMPVEGMQVVIGDNRPTPIPLESTLTPQP